MENVAGLLYGYIEFILLVFNPYVVFGVPSWPPLTAQTHTTHL